MKQIYLLIIITVFSFNKSMSQVIVSISDAVNVAGRQRMFGQRMAKNKVYLAAHKNTKDARTELKYTIYGFENGLKILKDFAPTEVIKQKVAAEENAFKTYKTQILNDSETSLKEVIETNTQFLNICDELVTEIINYANDKSLLQEDLHNKHLTKKVPEATDIAGELRYLTQRLTLYYALDDFEIEEVSSNEIESIVKTIEKDLNYLTILDFNTIKIDEEINDIRLDWTNLKKAIYSNEHVDLDKNKMSAVKLYKICNQILDKANITARMYTELKKS